MIFYETLENGSTYLLPCYCICRSLEFDMQHDHIPKKLNFGPQLYPLCSPRGSKQGLQTKIPLICFMSIIPLPAKRLDRFGKILTIDLVIEKFK